MKDPKQNLSHQNARSHPLLKSVQRNRLRRHCSRGATRICSCRSADPASMGPQNATAQSWTMGNSRFSDLRRRQTGAEETCNGSADSQSLSQKTLRQGNGILRSLQDVARAYRFPIVTCSDQNSERAVAQLRQWSPDLAIFTGGNILRDEVLKIPRLGVLNSHLALLPEIRGMSSPEWSLLCSVPLGITIHFMDRGVDTGPILLRREFTAAAECESLADLRNRMIAEGLDLLATTVEALDRNEVSAVPQADREKDNQYFVMHERLKALATRRLQEARLKNGPHEMANTCDRSGATMSRYDG